MKLKRKEKKSKGCGRWVGRYYAYLCRFVCATCQAPPILEHLLETAIRASRVCGMAVSGCEIVLCTINKD